MLIVRWAWKLSRPITEFIDTWPAEELSDDLRAVFNSHVQLSEWSSEGQPEIQHEIQYTSTYEGVIPETIILKEKVRIKRGTLNQRSRGNIIYKRLISFEFEKTPLFLQSCKLF